MLTDVYNMHSSPQHADNLLADYSSLGQFIGYMNQVVEGLRRGVVLQLYTDHLASMTNLRERLNQLVRTMKLIWDVIV